MNATAQIRPLIPQRALALQLFPAHGSPLREQGVPVCAHSSEAQTLLKALFLRRDHNSLILRRVRSFRLGGKTYRGANHDR